MRLSFIVCLTALFLGFTLTPLAAPEAPVYIDITATETSKVKIAIPPFMDTRSMTPGSGDMADLLAQGLEFHGFIQIVSPTAYNHNRKADWKTLGVDYSIDASYEIVDNTMVIEAKLLDALAGEQLLGLRYRGTRDKSDDMVLRFCDAVIGELSNSPGISRSRVAFIADSSDRKEVYVADVLGRHVRQVTRHKVLSVSPRFSPDGNLLAYSSYHAGNQNLYLTDLRQNKVTRAISRRKGMNMGPAWSPIGDKMVVTLSKDGSPDLYLMDIKGKIERQLTSRAGINVSPSWSSNGSTLAFVSDRAGTPQVYSMNIGSNRVQRLTFQGRENTEPVWSPTGDRIAYTSMVNGQYQIFVMDANGGANRQITRPPGQHESPSWSPDGRQLVVSRQLGRDRKICAVFLNGSSSARPLFNLKGRQSSPQWSKRSK